MNNIPDYCYTEEGSIYFLPAIQGLFKSYDRHNLDEVYCVLFRNAKGNTLEISENEYRQVYNAIKERDRLVREWINKDIK